jgi:hypothetical protein
MGCWLAEARKPCAGATACGHRSTGSAPRQSLADDRPSRTTIPEPSPGRTGKRPVERMPMVPARSATSMFCAGAS